MSAVFSDPPTHRLRLERGAGPLAAAWIGVNPSTAGADDNDPTVTKIEGFNARWFGGARLILGNKFAAITTDVRGLRAMADPIGRDNDAHLQSIFSDAAIVVFAWGPLTKLPRPLRDRWLDVYRLAIMAGHTPLCFGTVGDGHPRHPLMTPYAQPPEVWTRPNG